MGTTSNRVEPERDRDSRGRPRNARPRDELGRPLSRGAQGHNPETEDVTLAPEPALERAQQLLDNGRPFHAHEVLEATWKSATQNERDLWQGLAQLAVGLTHVLRGNNRGAAAVLRNGRDNIAGYAAHPPYEIDVIGLISWTDGLLGQLTEVNPWTLTNITAPRLRSR